MTLVNDGRNHLLDLLLGSSTEVLVNGGFGVDDDSLMSQTNIQGSVLTLDACDTTTGWSQGADAVAPTTDTTNYREGTGSVNAGTVYSAGDAHYTKTVSSVDLSSSNAKVYFFVYVDDITTLTDTTDAVYLYLGTGGVTNANKYSFSRGSLSNGWNALIATVGAVSSTIGSGATETGIDTVRIGFKSGNTISIGNLKFDYVRGVIDGGFGIPDSKTAFTTLVGDASVKITFKALSTQSNGYDLSSAATSTSTVLFSKASFSAINKDDDTEVQTDVFLTVE